MPQMPSLNSLRVFEAAARLSSFTRAAMELHVSQGAVSHQIRALEEELDTVLFYRTARQVILTDTGRSLSANLTEAFKIITSAVEIVRSERDPNEVRMIFPPNLSARWLVPRLPIFREKYPEILLTLRHSRHPEHADDDVDLAISWSGKRPNELAERFMGLVYAPVCTPRFRDQHKLTAIEQLVRCPLLGSRFCDWRDWFSRAGLPSATVKPQMVLDNFNVLINAVLDNQGVGLCPTVFVGDYVESERLVALSDVTSPSEEAFYLARTKQNMNRLAVRKVRRWLLEQVAH